jgi:hypothetical protein
MHETKLLLSKKKARIEGDAYRLTPECRQTNDDE